MSHGLAAALRLGLAACCDSNTLCHLPHGVFCCCCLQVMRAYARFVEGVCNDPWAATKYFA
jgi:hypothetical protein